MAIKCGRGNHLHNSAAEVWRCHNGENVESLPVTAPVVTATEDEPRATAKQIAFLTSLAYKKQAKTEADWTAEAAASGRWGRRAISAEIDRFRSMPNCPAGPAVRTTEPEYDSTTYDFRPKNPTESHATAQIPAELEAGMYRLDETIYKVQLAVHGSGKPYAKRLVVESELVRSGDDGDVYTHNVHFEYAPGAVRKLRPEHRMSLEEAKEFGALYGTCCVCGRTLTNEESIEKGIGPICEGKYF